MLNKMGAGAWQCGAERKLGEREKPSEISLHFAFELFQVQKVKEEREKSDVSLCKGGRPKEKVERACIHNASLS